MPEIGLVKLGLAVVVIIIGIVVVLIPLSYSSMEYYEVTILLNHLVSPIGFYRSCRLKQSNFIYFTTITYKYIPRIYLYIP